MNDSESWAAATANQIRAVEDDVLARVGEDPLMDRAADAVAAEARTMLGDRGAARVVLLVGTGNNGGDALLAGARLANDGASVTAVLLGDSAHPRGLEWLRVAGGEVIQVAGSSANGGVAAAAAAIEAADLVVDGIVGIGASPGLREPSATLVGAIPARTPVLAVDLPSGMDPDGGSVTLPHVHATVTVTFTSPKPCLLLPPAALDAGRIVVASVGIPLPKPLAEAPRRLTPEGAAAWWPVPGPGDDKYSRGVVGVVAGSDRYPGAAILACSAAVRVGAGLVRYLGPRRVQDLVLTARPEVVAAEAPAEADALPRVGAWVLGPGVADEPGQEAAIEAALASGLPAVVDAGAIEACVRARVGGGRATPFGRLLLTPHAGELARALAAAGETANAEAVEADPAEAARLLAHLSDATVLLKGAVTLVVSPGGPVWSQADAPPWLATAGAGDVLAGIAGVLLASGLEADEAGALAALVHGRAATLASGGGPIAALDVADALPATVDALRETVKEVLKGR
ncbi:MAG: NAD(P)H-hydrate dehydratase [Demequinaceae bacterium]|nr:NAD(P)H-hydrate dehydratase [Demequinaceae bacterium]